MCKSEDGVCGSANHASLCEQHGVDNGSEITRELGPCASLHAPPQSYDISSGTCNREAIATVLGGVVGGVVASRVASPENRTVAMIIGAIAGAAIGNRIGEKLDDADRGCFAHVLEIAKSRQRISWANEVTQVRYELSPGADRQRNGAACREFTLVTVAGKAKSSHRGVACQAQPGAWQIAE